MTGVTGRDGQSANGRRPRERAIVAALRRGPDPRWRVDESLEELAALVTAAGAEVAARVVQEREAPTPSLYLGRGKVAEIGEQARALGAGLLVLDDALSPVQERNLSQALGLKVVDRTALILDIFAQRARTREGKLQVELAQLTYLMPRLVGQWKHLERLGGGIGTRGPGETQLESDRRVIRRRVMQITRELERVKTHRRVQREGRRRAGLPVAALVGYTNAGKTTLLNRLTGASLVAADQLFVTLDPAARLVAGGPGRSPFILTDTVGFIRKLPHELVAAFRATLEELADADLLLHVVDAGHPQLEEHRTAVDRLLADLEVAARPTLLVLNKVDRLPAATVDALARSLGGVPVSATTAEGIEALLAAIRAALPPFPGTVTLRIPHAAGTALASCYDRGRVLARADEPHHVRLEVELPAELLGSLAAYRV